MMTDGCGDPSCCASTAEYEVEVQYDTGHWARSSTVQSLVSAKRLCKEALKLGYKAARVLKVTREVLP